MDETLFEYAFTVTQARQPIQIVVPPAELTTAYSG